MTINQSTQHNVAVAVRLWGPGLGLLLVAIGLASYALLAMSVSATPATSQTGYRAMPPQFRRLMQTLGVYSLVQSVWPETTPLDPAQRGVMDYVRTHTIVRSAAPLAAPADPVSESVLNYVKAHELALRPVAADPAVWGVLTYVQAHELALPAVTVDPAAQGILNYIRAHELDQ